MQNDPHDFSPTLFLCQIEAALTRNAECLKSLIKNLSDRNEDLEKQSVTNIGGHHLDDHPKELNILFMNCELILNELSQLRVIFGESSKLEAGSRMLNSSIEVGSKRRFAFPDAFSLMPSMMREKKVVEIPLERMDSKFQDYERPLNFYGRSKGSIVEKQTVAGEIWGRDRNKGMIKSVPRKSSDRNIIITDSDRKIPLSNDHNNGWICPICTLNNASRLRLCDACNSRRPSSSNTTGSKATDQLKSSIQRNVTKSLPKKLSKKSAQMLSIKDCDDDGPKNIVISALELSKEDLINSEEGSLNIIEVSMEIEVDHSASAYTEANDTSALLSLSKNNSSSISTTEKKSVSFNTECYPSYGSNKEMKSISTETETDTDIYIDKESVTYDDPGSGIHSNSTSDFCSGSSGSGSGSGCNDNSNIDSDKHPYYKDSKIIISRSNADTKINILATLLPLEGSPTIPASKQTVSMKTSAQSFWICGSCTVENPIRDKICDLCGQPKVPKVPKNIETLPASYRKLPRIGVVYQIDIENIPTARVKCKRNNLPGNTLHNDTHGNVKINKITNLLSDTTNDLNRDNTTPGENLLALHGIIVNSENMVHSNKSNNTIGSSSSRNSDKNNDDNNHNDNEIDKDNYVDDIDGDEINYNDSNDLWEVLWLCDRTDTKANDDCALENEEVTTNDGEIIAVSDQIDVDNDEEVTENEGLMTYNQEISIDNKTKNNNVDESKSANESHIKCMEVINEKQKESIEIIETANETEKRYGKDKNNHHILSSSISLRSSSIMGPLSLTSDPMQLITDSTRLKLANAQINVVTFENKFLKEFENDRREDENQNGNGNGNGSDSSSEKPDRSEIFDFKKIDNMIINVNRNDDKNSPFCGSLNNVSVDHLENIINNPIAEDIEKVTEGDIENGREIQDLMIWEDDIKFNANIFKNKLKVKSSNELGNITTLHDYLNLYPHHEVECLKILLNCKYHYSDAINLMYKTSSNGKLITAEKFLVLETKNRLKFQNAILRHGTNWAAVKV